MRKTVLCPLLSNQMKTRNIYQGTLGTDRTKIAIKGAFGAGTDVGEDYLGEFLGLAGISWRPVVNSPAIADAAPQHHLEQEGEGQENPLYEAQHTV